MAELVGKPYDPASTRYAPDDPHFDPLIDLAGMWTTELAERYLPIPGTPLVKYECLDGNLIMSPYEGSPNGYAVVELMALMRSPAKEANRPVYPTLNIALGPGPQRWIQPDINVLKQPIKGLTWVPVERLLMPIELVSPSSRRRDRIDKPALCAEAGVPFFMWVEIDGEDIEVELLQLRNGRYRPLVKVFSGERFETELPFPLAFDTAALIEPEG
ncbi:Uma2 family endonuclease [Allokutzneria multivorans]|uniref:Uma2 family endonuclease n=1 Tax=Allokutzneria multivorans TaxID=1142134 RepID=UPI0031EFB98C